MPILFGKPIAEKILQTTEAFIKEYQLKPALAVILIGSDAGSEIYIKLKSEAAQRIGIKFSLYRFSDAGPLHEVRSLIERLNADSAVHGIIIQLPLPQGWDTDELIRLIRPEKDADGFHPEVVRNYLNGERSDIPVLPRAINTLIQSTGVVFEQTPAVAVVNSDLFGAVIAHSLTEIGLSVTVMKSHQVASQKNILETAQVVVSVCGKPGLIDIVTLRRDAIVVDAGITRVEGIVMGDVTGDKASYPGWITPIPGGVGPLTIACLLERVAFMTKRTREK